MKSNIVTAQLLQDTLSRDKLALFLLSEGFVIYDSQDHATLASMAAYVAERDGLQMEDIQGGS